MYNLYSYLVMFVPSIMGMFLYNKLSKNTKMDYLKLLIYVLLSNVCAMVFLHFKNGFDGSIIDSLVSYSYFSCKYAILLILINFVFAVLNFALNKYLTITIRVDHEKKNN